MASGYDLSVSTFSPDGKVFQVEYACKAVESGALSLAAVFKDGVVLGAEKWQQSPLILKESRCRVFKLDEHACAIVTGSLPDGKNLVEQARTECAHYRRTWGIPIPGAVLADRVGVYVHGHTSVWSTRPIGASLMMCVHERRKRQSPPGAGSALDSVQHLNVKTADESMMAETESSVKDWSLWIVDPTGAAYKYKANSQGKGAPGAKTDLSKLSFETMSIDEGVKELAKIIYKQHDDNSREKQLCLEMMILQDGLPHQLTAEELAPIEAEAQRYVDELEA